MFTISCFVRLRLILDDPVLYFVVSCHIVIVLGLRLIVGMSCFGFRASGTRPSSWNVQTWIHNVACLCQ